MGIPTIAVYIAPDATDDQMRGGVGGFVMLHGRIMWSARDSGGFNLPWIMSYRFEPHDGTSYELVVGHDPARHDSTGQNLIALTTGRGGSYWFPTETAFHPGYVLDKIASGRHGFHPTYGLRAAVISAAVILGIRDQARAAATC